ncbi:MAG: glycosyltransferase [Cyanobacteriota bacterium]
MKIAIVSKSCYSFSRGTISVPLTLAGHTIAFVRQLIPYLLERGYQISLLVPVEAGIGDSVYSQTDDQIPDGIIVIPFSDYFFPKVPISCSFITFFLALTEAKEKMGRIDWVFSVYSFPLLILIDLYKPDFDYQIAAFLRGGDGYKFLDPDLMKKLYGSELDMRSVASLYKRALNRANYVFTVSEWLRSRVNHFGVRVSEVIPAPALVNPLRKTGEPIRKESVIELMQKQCKWGSPSPFKNWLLSASRLSQDKRIDLAIKAFEAWHRTKWQLIIAGTGPSEHRILELIKQSKVAHNIVLLFAPPDSMAALFAASNAYIHTAIPSENFIDSRPSSITSAVFYGKPIVLPLSQDGGAIESVSPINLEHFGFHISSDEELLLDSVVNALRKLEDETLLRDVGAANQHFAIRFHPEEIFSGITKFLSQ